MPQQPAASPLDPADTERFRTLLDRLVNSLEADRRAVEAAAETARAQVAAALAQ